MPTYLTIGQVAQKLRISTSTLKRWLSEPQLSMVDRRNHIGWRLFDERDIVTIREYKTQLKRSGRRFNGAVLMPSSDPDIKKKTRKAKNETGMNHQERNARERDEALKIAALPFTLGKAQVG